MRITAQMNQNTSLRQLTGSYNKASKLNEMIGAERQIMDLQDNPSGALTGMKMLNLIARTRQYQDNVKLGISSLNLSDANLGTIKGKLDDAMKLLVGAADESTTPDARKTNATEVGDILKQILNTANSKSGLRYLFGGTYSGSAPFSTYGKYFVYNGNNQSIPIHTGANSTTSVNVTGTDAFGNMSTTIPSRDLNPGVNMGTDTSTSLSALNGGSGVPKGKIMVYYSSYPNGLEVDLSGCDTLEDVKDCIEKATLDASRNLDPASCSWLDGGNLDWRDLQDRYVKVTMNPDGNGISLQEYDLGEPLPEPTVKEQKKGLDYSGAPGYDIGGGGAGIGAGTVHDKDDYIYSNGGKTYAPLRVDNHAGNRVATALGIKGTANAYDPARPDARLDGFIHGADLNPVVTGSTLLSDLEGYNDGVYYITNGDKPGGIAIRETSADSSHVFNNWNLGNLSKGYNTGSDGDLYVRVTRRGAPDDDIFVEVYTKPLDQAKASDLVATGTTTGTGGTVVLNQANESGVGGTVGIHLPTTKDEASISLGVEWSENLSAAISVPAFVEEKNANGTSKDYLNLLSGWHITGLDKPPATGYDLNHPASTDKDGNVSVNVRMVDNGDGTTSALLEIYRPAYDDQPAALVATGELNLGGHPPLDTPASGRIAIQGVEGFEAVGGSVYFELPAGVEFGDGAVGTGPDSATNIAYQLPDDMAPNVEIVLGGAMRLVQNQTLGADMTLKADTVLKAGTTFATDVTLPNGTILSAGDPLPADTTFKKGTVIGAGAELAAGTELAAGQTVTFADGLKAGTVVPAGSYTTDGVSGFPADGMMSADAAHAGEAMGFNLTATFATVEDLKRAVEEAGIYATVEITDKGFNFVSQLGGAYLTVSEDVDCYEQMNDKYQQISALDLNGLVKGVNSDANGDLHTEVVFYPPDPNRTDGKAVLLSKEGEQILIDAGYYVRLYSDADALSSEYQDRDNSSLVAEGFIPAGTWDNTDPDNPYVPLGTVGVARPLLLEERNNSGVSGSMDFDYYGGRDQADSVNGDYAPYNNAGITVTPGGLRSTGSLHTTVQEVDISGFTPGRQADFSGVSHATISRDEAGTTTTVSIYRDSSRSHMAAKGEINAQTGEVVLYETDKSGNYVLDANNQRIAIGSLVVSDNTLADGQSDDFTITMGGVDNSGQKRETNMFSTLADIVDAMNANDVEALHDLIDVLQSDIDRLVDVRGNASSRSARLTLLSDRYTDDILSYNTSYTATIGMDADAMAKAVLDMAMAEHTYNAAMQVSSRLLQMSLLSYL